MEEVWQAHKSRVGKKCSPQKVNKGGCPKVEDYLIFHPCLGTLGAIAGKASMGLVNLDQPEKLLCKVKRKCKEDVRELQFSLGAETLFAIAAGTKVSYFMY